MNGFLSFRHSLPMIFQREASECGLACLAMLVNFHGRREGLRSLREKIGFSGQGASARDLLSAAAALRMRGRAVKLGPQDLNHLTLPAVLHWDMDHFVILKRIGLWGMTIHDPAVGIKTYRRADLLQHFTGIALEFTPQQDFQPGADHGANRLTLARLLPSAPWLKQSLLQVFILSLLIQALALLAPLYLQLVIDQGISRGDMDLVVMLALLFGLLVLARTLISHLRGMLLLGSTNLLGFHLVSDTFHHLLRLPLQYFERRDMGDIVSRFSALESVKQLITREMVTVLVDGLFSAFTISLLFFYNPFLATVSVATVLLISAMRYFALNLERNRRLETVELQARQQSRFMDSLRSVSTIKINGMEAERESDWLDRYSEYTNSSFGLGRLQLTMGSIESMLIGLENIVVVFLGSQLIYSGGLTLGQLMSFIFLKQHFFNAILAMIPKLAELKLMNVELDRIADIRLQQVTDSNTAGSLLNPVVHGEVVARGLRFTYPGARSAVFNDLNLELHAGEVTALTGPSGCGKSTLLKLLLGLENPDRGVLTIDGLGVTARNLDKYREQIAAVLHNESLLAGTLASNITLGQDPGNQERLREVCELVDIAALIARLPMGFATRVGELGSQFSAGQIKRLLIARALYRQPAFLLLDETLTNLGQGTAPVLVQRIRERCNTVVIVSHDPEVLATADRVVSIGCDAGAARLEKPPSL